MTAGTGEHEVRRTSHLFPQSYTEKRSLKPYIVAIAVILGGVIFALRDKLPF